MPTQACDGASAAEEGSVLRAAEHLVRAFGKHDVDAYFAHFAQETTFIFYNHERPLRSRSEYEALWAEWEAQAGFRVLSCTSSNRHVGVFGEVAVFTHDVDTRTRSNDGGAELAERETIIFHRRNSSWVAVHEHLSPRPGE